MVKIICQVDGFAIRLVQVQKRDLITTAADHYTDDQEPAIFADIGHQQPVRWVVTAVNEEVFFLRIANPVKIDTLVPVQALKFIALLRCRETAVKKAAAVRLPGQRRKFHPFDFILQLFAAGDIQDANGTPVRAAVLNGHGGIAPVGADLDIGQRHRAIG